MLSELTVQNLAVIEDVRLEFGPGFTALTGETGAGKSLLLNAVGLLLGERGDADLIRAGKDELRVTGRFILNRPEQRAAVAGILETELDDTELILSRKLTKAGRGSALANDHPVAVATLRKLGELLVDVHGQHESTSLLQPTYQLELLDAYGKHHADRAKYEQYARQLRELRTRHGELQTAKQTRQKELALARFEWEELDAAALVPHEYAKLEAERDRLTHARALAAFATETAAKLYDDDGSVAEIIGRVAKDAQHWAAMDTRIAEVAKRVELLKPEVQDLADMCRDMAEEFEDDPERLDEVEARLKLLGKLETKYNQKPDELIPYRNTLKDKIKSLLTEESDLVVIEAKANEVFEKLVGVAKTLSKLRTKSAKALAKEVETQLHELQMPNAMFDVTLRTVAVGKSPFAGDIPGAGYDELEFVLAANPGEAPLPLRKVASGGELSRTLLALKTVLAAHDPVRTLVVFDEVDANVGGRLGDVVGQKLAALGKSHQVICVTHLAQVAAHAQAQWAIRKQVTGARTSATVKPLVTDDTRVEELAAMLRGDARSATTLKEAAEMLAAAKSHTRPTKAKKR